MLRGEDAAVAAPMQLCTQDEISVAKLLDAVLALEAVFDALDLHNVG